MDPGIFDVLGNSLNLNLPVLRDRIKFDLTRPSEKFGNSYGMSFVQSRGVGDKQLQIFLIITNANC